MPPRKLRLTHLDQIMPEVDRLQRLGYIAHGKWDLAQTCEHLADWMMFPLDGYPRVSLPISWMLSLMRYFQGKKMLNEMLRTGTMKANSPTLPATIYGPGRDSQSAVDRFAMAVQQLTNHSGPIHPSPLFGELTRDELVGLQLAHCSHHLSFLEPREQ